MFMMDNDEIDSGEDSGSSSASEIEVSAVGQTDEVHKQKGNNSNDVEVPTAEDICNTEFGSEEDAYNMYVKYAKFTGFGVRKGYVTRDDISGNIIRRNFLCCKAGKREAKYLDRPDRKKEPKPETRTNCPARLVVYLDKTSSTWKVRRLDENHNHELTDLRFVHLIANHRHITEADKAQINSMHRHGMQTSRIMGFMAGQAGGFMRVGFSRKDLYNYLDRERHAKLKDGDAATTISYFEGKADVDPMFVARYTTTEDECLGNLFWVDGLRKFVGAVEAGAMHEDEDA